MRRSPFRPWFECLEERTNPGVVTVSFAAGTLTLTGSSGADSIAISQPSFGVIQLVGDGTTPIRIGATGPIIPAATPVTFGSAAAPVKTLNANLGLGNDSFTVDLTTSISLQSSVTVDLGAGTNQQFDTANETDPTSINVGGSYTVKAGSGVDTITTDNFHVAGNMVINAGDGANSITTDYNSNSRSTVGGALTISSGIGSETITMFETDVVGLTTINLGTGNVVTGLGAQVTIDSSGVGINFGGGLQILAAAADTGNDTITFAAGGLGATIGGPPTGGLYVSTFGGNDTVALNDVINTAGTRILTGAGDDSVLLDGPDLTATFAGPVQISTGDGNDTLEVGTGGPVDFLNSVNANLGAGNDSLTLATTGPVGFSAGFLAVFDGGGGLTGGFNQKTVTAANVTGPLPQLLNFF